MLWFLIVPMLWFFLLREMWLSTDSDMLSDMLTWPSGFMGWAATAFGLALCAVIGSLVAVGIAELIGSRLDRAKIWHLEDRSTRELISVRDKDGVQGAFSGGLFLVAGRFESRPYYFYYTRDLDGAIHPDRIPASERVFIHEIDGADAKLVERQWDNGRPWLDLIAFTYGGWQYHFYVPKGTVRREFTM